MVQVVYRQNNMFIIDKDLIIGPVNKKDQVCNALYAAIYTEFLGANENPTYKNQTHFQRVKALNKFAYDWLKSRGLIE